MLFQVWRVKAQRAHARDQMFRELGGAMTWNDLRRNFLLHKPPGTIARCALLIGEKFFDVVVIERVHTCELANARQSSGCANELNGSAWHCENPSTIFTRPNRRVIVAAVDLRFYPVRLKNFVRLVLVAPIIGVAAENVAPQKSGGTNSVTEGFGASAAERFAKLALACVHKEYPNKISHVLNSDADVAPPRKLTPAFCGCYDWHSSVHGHWLLVRLLRTFPDASFAKAARDALKTSLTAENLKVEAAYLRGEGRASFERPYGLAWLLQLCAELREWDDPQAQEMLANLKPLEQAAVERLTAWLPKLSQPVRIGEHDQTAFALGLILDYARVKNDQALARLASDSARKFFLADQKCPLAYEPSGEDFLSPCLGEADVMRRVLPPAEFAKWLTQFLPQIPSTAIADWLPVTVSPDPSDPKLAHLDGLNLSRAWMLEGILSALPADDPRQAALASATEAHRRAGLAAVTGEHYEGGHWLGSFAVYLTTKRGIKK